MPRMLVSACAHTARRLLLLLTACVRASLKCRELRLSQAIKDPHQSESASRCTHTSLPALLSAGVVWRLCRAPAELANTADGRCMAEFDPDKCTCTTSTMNAKHKHTRIVMHTQHALLAGGLRSRPRSNARPDTDLYFCTGQWPQCMCRTAIVSTPYCRRGTCTSRALMQPACRTAHGGVQACSAAYSLQQHYRYLSTYIRRGWLQQRGG